VQVVKRLASVQVVLAKCGRLALKHGVDGNAIKPQQIKNIGFSLALAADLIERNNGIRAALDVPRGGQCLGFIDTSRCERSRGAAILDWAWLQTEDF
jgi:hypothetical protein